MYKLKPHGLVESPYGIIFDPNGENPHTKIFIKWLSTPNNVPKPLAVVDPMLAVRTERDGRLKASDWTQLADASLSASTKAAWAAYRAELKDIPQLQSGTNIETVVWPTPPV